MSEPKTHRSAEEDRREMYDIERSYLVVQHNDLIQNNRYTLEKNKDNSPTLVEQKILLYVVSKIKYDTKEFDFVPIKIKEFAKVIGCGENENGVYSQVKNAITKLAARVMWLKSIDEEITVRWIDKAKISKYKGTIYIKLDNDLKPYLTALYGNFTAFPLHSVIRMKSKYGIMLYEILRSYIFRGNKLEFTISDLKERLDCTSYENFTNFDRRVLRPALSDINKYTEIYVRASYIKTGRSYTSVLFDMKDLSKAKSEEERAEAIRRYYEVEKEVDSRQISLFDLMGGDDL